MNMKNVICLLLSIYCLTVIISCTQEASTRTNNNNLYPENKVTVKGTVKFIAGWGTREIHKPSGYYLYNLTWVNKSIPIKGELFLKGRIENKYYLDKRVYVEGLLQIEPGRTLSPVNDVEGYEYIAVDSICVIE